MKSKSIIGAALAAIFTLGVTTSCEDMFDIDSSRVVIEKDHTLSSSADSAYTTLGVLQCMKQVLDRYIILGEVRGDLVEINEHTKTSLRNLAEFNFDDDNEYLDIKDYYAIINNCNYALAKMDTTLAHNNERVMIDEYAALLSIRAWTYLQLGINYGKVPYYTDPITTVADSEKKYPELDIKGLAAELIPQLTPYVDYDFPVFTGVPQTSYPPIQVLIGDFYLWTGEYANAWDTYWDYLTTNPNYNYEFGEEGQEEIIKGYMGLNGMQVKSIQSGTITGTTLVNWDSYLNQNTLAPENLTQIAMQYSTAQGTVSEIASLFVSTDNTHPLNPSTYWSELSKKQTYIRASIDSKTGEETGGYVPNSTVGDQRSTIYYGEPLLTVAGIEDFKTYEKHSVTSLVAGELDFYTSAITLYRRSIVYLRAAEAANALAKELYVAGDSVKMAEARTYATNAFNLMKDAYQVFFPEGHILEDLIRPKFIGVHAKGCGDIRLDTTHYALTSKAIALKLYDDELLASSVTFNDTINYLDELIIDELALEATLEGNRFGDLIRFSERRGRQGLEENETHFLANRVAKRKGEEHFDEVLYNKLSENKDLWYLPIK